MRWLFTRKFGGLTGLLICLILQPSVHADTFIVGVVPQYDVRTIKKIWFPILNSLRDATGHQFVLRGSATISTFEKEFNEGRFDFVYMNPFHVAVLNDAEGYLPLVRDVDKHVQGVIVVRRDSDIQTVQQLANTVMAFPAPNALGASMMIRADLQEKFDIRVQPKYVSNHSSVYFNVVLKQADAGGGVQKTLNQQKPQIRDNLRILYRTAKVPPHPLTAHPRVPPKLRRQVQQTLLNLGQTKAGQRMLSAIPIDRIGMAKIEDYEVIRNMGLKKYYVD